MRVNKLDCNEGWDETKRFLGAKNTPKGSCFLFLSVKRIQDTRVSSQKHCCFFCNEIRLKYIQLQFFLADL